MFTVKKIVGAKYARKIQFMFIVKQIVGAKYAKKINFLYDSFPFDKLD